MSEVTREVKLEFLRRFAAGEQYLYINKAISNIEESPKQYYWQESAVYNLIQPLLNSRKLKFLEYLKNKSDTYKEYVLSYFDEIELTSVVERLVSIQRAYNSIKNKKAEFFTRISLGSLAVEDGSVDADTLQEEGIAPGKIIVYRQGSKLPQQLDTSLEIYSLLTQEEDKLVAEFYRLGSTEDLDLYFDCVFQDALKEKEDE